MAEVNLLKNYPTFRRQLNKRARQKTEAIRSIARQFGKEYFDGERNYGYGGYSYHPRFWRQVVKDFQAYYQLTSQSKILDVGCAKGFMLHDFREIIPGISTAGIDLSVYAVEHAMDDVKAFIQIGNARELPYNDNSFDLVISINTIHNLPLRDCKKAIHEIMRVSKHNVFITVDAYRNDREKKQMEAWNLTAQTIFHVDDWKKLFKEVNYRGDYYWFIA